MEWLPRCDVGIGSPEARAAVKRLLWWAIGLSVVAAAALLGAAALLRGDPEGPAWARGAIALAPLLPFAGMFIALVRVNRHLDEFAVRIQFEALAATMIVSTVLIVGWGQLQKADILPLVKISAAWPPMVIVYAGAYWFALRRYR